MEKKITGDTLGVFIGGWGKFIEIISLNQEISSDLLSGCSFVKSITKIIRDHFDFKCLLFYCYLRFLVV